MATTTKRASALSGRGRVQVRVEERRRHFERRRSARAERTDGGRGEEQLLRRRPRSDVRLRRSVAVAEYDRTFKGINRFKVRLLGLHHISTQVFAEGILGSSNIHRIIIIANSASNDKCAMDDGRGSNGGEWMGGGMIGAITDWRYASKHVTLTIQTQFSSHVPATASCNHGTNA